MLSSYLSILNSRWFSDATWICLGSMIKDLLCACFRDEVDSNTHAGYNANVV